MKRLLLILNYIIIYGSFIVSAFIFGHSIFRSCLREKPNRDHSFSYNWSHSALCEIRGYHLFHLSGLATLPVFKGKAWPIHFLLLSLPWSLLDPLFLESPLGPDREPYAGNIWDGRVNSRENARVAEDQLFSDYRHEDYPTCRLRISVLELRISH